MDSSKDVESVREQLVVYGEQALPIMVECFPDVRTWRGRQAIISTAIKFARRSETAKQLGFMGLKDKSKRVRQCACALAAFSLEPDFLPELNTLLTTSDTESAADAEAAINAIRGQSHHLFMDRQNTGRVRWNVAGSGIDS